MTEFNSNMDFEEAYNALCAVTEQLENPENNIEENIALYEKACQLVLHCRKKLDDAKVRITDINERIAQIKNSDENTLED